MSTVISIAVLRHPTQLSEFIATLMKIRDVVKKFVKDPSVLVRAKFAGLTIEVLSDDTRKTLSDRYNLTPIQRLNLYKCYKNKL